MIPMSDNVSTPNPLIAPAGLHLPISGPDFVRPDSTLIRDLYQVSSATASALLHHLGIRQTFIQGPVTRQPGAKVVGAAVTLQFMPQREDVVSGKGQEKTEQRSALWAVLEAVQTGDVLVIAAQNDPYTGCMGEMLVTYFGRGRGGAGIVVDGCIRDWPNVQKIGVPLWTCGVTPNYASQSSLFPWAYNVPIACNRVLVLPGDIIIADDDGAVCVPAQMAPSLASQALEKEDWEAFSRMKLAEGGALKTYYPLSEEGQREYIAWKQTQGR
jgi:regulator of RNase E activity RraA